MLYANVKDCNEATIRSYFIEPMLRELAKHLCHLPIPPSQPYTLFTATVTMEHAVPLHRGSGWPATVDYCVVLQQDEGNVRL